MDQLVSKLHDLSYEFFGILAPGSVGLLVLCLWFAALGPLVPACTGDVLPTLTLESLVAFVEGMKWVNAAEVAVVAYLIGHTLHWLSRRGDPLESSEFWPNMWAALKLKPAKGPSYSKALQPVLDLLLVRFADPQLSAPLAWGSFYSLARVFVQPRLSSSLIAIYQHKYTLHRSIACVAAILVWLCVVGLLAMLACRLWLCGAAPDLGINAAFLGAMAATALGLVWTFSQSYKYYWTLFGSAVITETYTLLLFNEPKPC